MKKIIIILLTLSICNLYANEGNSLKDSVLAAIKKAEVDSLKKKEECKKTSHLERMIEINKTVLDI